MKKLILFFTLISISLFAQAGLFDQNKPDYLSANQAFIFSSTQTAQQIHLNWQIATGYYLYKKEIHVVSHHTQIDDLQFPPSEKHQDEFFGEVDIFRNNLALNIPLKHLDDAQIEVTYQGCTKGFCYSPETKIIQLNKNLSEIEPQNEKSENSTSLSALEPTQDRLAQDLLHNKYAVFWFFLLGLGLAFTPCVLPMLPLLSAIVVGREQRPHNWKAFTLSFTYVQGMAFTYTALGLTVTAIGLPFQIALQNPYVLGFLSCIFILLALSMFGLFTLQLPSALQTKLTLLSQRQKSGVYSGVFIMGMLAGLVASPCTSAPLSGALLYIAQSGNLWMGAITLYLLALGMGIPLVLITIFGNNILPKSGAWMENVKISFGFVMLTLPIFLLSRFLPSQVEPLLWSLLGMSFTLWLSQQMNQSVLGRICRTALIISAIILAKPLQDQVWCTHNNPLIGAEKTQPEFKKITTYEELNQTLAQNNKPLVMLDLYADWCVACKEFAQYTFSDEHVKQRFKHILLLQVDMTKNSDANKTLMQKLAILGLPTIIFFDQQGKEIPNSRITGFMEAIPFNQWLQRLLNN